ncbi:MAG: hypothetical protein CMJ64_08015 [Planctomycetaceae bacterium]|nr:hypothetical protein [Planctomycetaceae bacterium]
MGGTESSRRDTGCKATTYWQTTPNWKKPFPQPAVFTGLPSRDSLGVYHAISRLLGQFETFGAKTGEGESSDFGYHDQHQIA